MITISQATWQYTAAEKPTMEGVDLVIEPGEMVVLCGASGSGKSTLLRMMNGLIPHFHEGTLSGRVTVSGLDVRKSALDEARTEDRHGAAAPAAPVLHRHGY